MKYLVVFSVLLLISPAFAQTPFRDTAGLTKNGIEWCEENYQIYKMMRNDFFEHHQHSIESRLCGNLYNDDLWTYSKYDRYQKLIEQSRLYYELEIQESFKESQGGKIDTKPVSTREIPQEIAQQQKEITEIGKLQITEKLADESPCGPGAIYQDGMCVVVNSELDPILMPISDYDYGLIYMIVLPGGIICSIIGGVIFIIRKKAI